MIHRRLGKSKKFAALKSDRSRVLYTLIYTYTDREGRFSGDPEEIKTECCPYLKYSIKKIAESIIDLNDVGLLILYEDLKTKKPVVEFVAFDEFQKIRKDKEAASIYSRPPAQGQDKAGTTPGLYLSLSLMKGMKRINTTTPQIDFSFPERKFLNIKIEDKAGWKDAYPAVDIDQEIRIAREWLLANPKRAKSNYRQFLNNWFRREQDKGGSQRFKRAEGGRPMTRKDRAKKDLDDWEKKPVSKKD